MINKDNKVMYDKITDFYNTFSKDNEKNKKAIIEAFKIGFNDTKNPKTCKIVKGIYKTMKFLPQHSAEILTSDLMMNCLENNCTNCLEIKEEK
jgi:hypothetical protein